MQRHGTKTIGRLFGPATILWFLAIAAIGLPWGVFFIGWIAAGMLTPSGTDNTPIRARGPLDIEHELVEA